ncbi:dehalogenase [Ancylomarina longa]|uniref:Dehalogenase n=1 Tax=Ancylomarina longa TaxID=2487017 RepID=A0A434AZ69_9BACT|nr:dehalogenase [Ancylomarina longa]RUT79890.1 dehalogenase [Ancylomarina longa]
MVFSGTETLFYLLGILTTLIIMVLIKYNKQFKFSALSWSLLGLGSFLLLFCIAWSVSSVLEGVPRASSMGLVVFGIPSILLLLFGRKIALKKK